MTHIVIIDDDRELCELVGEFLKTHKITTESYRSPTLGLKALKEKPADLAIVDVMLPEMEGFEVCRRLRSFSQIPVIMLSARGQTPDRIKGIEQGADDYIAKPFDPKELLLRIHAILKRAQPREHNLQKQLQVRDIFIDKESRTATLRGEELKLSSTEFDALYLFCANAGQIITREQLCTFIWGSNWQPNSRSMDILLSRLRQKLGDDHKNPTYIKTVWGKGYALVLQSDDLSA